MWFQVSRKSPFRNSERNETEFREIIEFYEAANKSRLCLSAFCSKKWFGTDFRVFSVPKIGSEWNYEVLLFQKWFGTKVRGFSLPKNGSKRNSEGFSLSRNRQNSDGNTICSVFRGIIFLSENGNPSSTYLLVYVCRICSKYWCISKICRKCSILDNNKPYISVPAVNTCMHRCRSDLFLENKCTVCAITRWA